MKTNKKKKLRTSNEYRMETDSDTRDPQKGDREDAGNYRPICLLPVLYKLFATAMYARLAPSLHKVQPPGHQTVDHLMVYKLLEQRCREWDVHCTCRQ